MNLLSGKWVSADGFALRIKDYPNGKLDGTYQISLPDQEINLFFKGVSLYQEGILTFAAVLECDPCEALNWTGKITLHGSLDQPHSTLTLQWLCTSGIVSKGQKTKTLRGKSVLLRVENNNLHQPAGYSAELFAPHTLMIQERDRPITKPTMPSKKRKS